MSLQGTVDRTIIQRFESDNYSLLEKIGQGGFGQVFRAKQVNTGQIVAIKFLTLSSDFDEEKRRRYIERFHRETSLCSRLQHPNIVRLLDKGICDQDLVFAVFEYVEGQSLKEILQNEGALLPSEAANLMSQVLDSLAHAHGQGVIHRDLKPANIMLTKSGAKDHVKILDFGIGTLTNEARKQDFKTITLTHETLGTPSYSAPEQLRGEPPTIKSDLYVWGLVFIECLTGQPAVTGSSLASIFHKQLSNSNVPIPTSLAGHPIADLLRRVLNKKSQERAEIAAEVYQDLSQINFSSLVGDLKTEPLERMPVESSLTASHYVEETQINDNAVLFTGLTERKQISVLCVTLNIASITDGVMDLEVIDALHRDQKSQCLDIAIRFGAFHAGTLGDTLLFYFGYPTVSDNDSRLCARTALEISSSLNQRNALLKSTQGIEVLVRMGIHTGLVTNYSDTAPEGDTPNIAMELARHALPKQVLCSDASKKLLDTYIEFTPDAIKPIGVNQKQVTLHHLVGERSVEAFGFLRGNRANHEFVGRDQELAELVELLNERNDDSVAHVFGDAGIGKSRLIFELRNRANNFQHFIAQCLPEHKYNALYPILNVLKYKYSLDSLEAEVSVEKFRSLLSEVPDLDETLAVPLLCTWLHLPLPDDLSVVTQAPDIQKSILFDTLIVLLLNDIEANSIRHLFIFEDMHWADPTSIEFIQNLINHTLFKDKDSVFISTSRKALPSQLEEGVDVGFEVLGLSKASTNAFIQSLFDHQHVSENVLDVVTSRTDGIPLFIEELVNMLRSKTLVQHLNGVVDFVSEDKLAEVPETLLESLQQKLDGLVSAKDTAQLAATIGREFDYDLLVAASNKTEEFIQTDLNELIANELVIRQRQVNGDSYIFKHALVRDAAYGSTGLATSKRYHKSVADSLLCFYGKENKEYSLNVAEHYLKAEEFINAVDHYIYSILSFVSNSAYNEAISIYYKAIACIPFIEEEDIRLRSELGLCNSVVTAEMTVNGYGGESLSVINSRIKFLIGEIEINKYQDGVLNLEEIDRKSDWIRFQILHYSSKRKEARELGEDILTRAREEGDRQKEMLILTHLAQAYMIDGDLIKSKKSYEKASSLYDEDLDKDLALEFGTDGKAQLLSLSSITYLHLGELSLAKDAIREAVEYSEYINHDSSIAFAYLFKALYGYFTNDIQLVLETGNEYNNKYEHRKSSVWHYIYVKTLYSAALGDTESSIECLDLMIDTGQIFAISWYVPIIVDAYINSNDPMKAVSLCEKIISLSIEHDISSAVPFLKLKLAESYFMLERKFSNKISFLINESICLSKKQSSDLFELQGLNLKEKLDESNMFETERSRLIELRSKLINNK